MQRWKAVITRRIGYLSVANWQYFKSWMISAMSWGNRAKLYSDSFYAWRPRTLALYMFEEIQHICLFNWTVGAERECKTVCWSLFIHCSSEYNWTVGAERVCHNVFSIYYQQAYGSLIMWEYKKGTCALFMWCVQGILQWMFRLIKVYTWG